MIIKLPREVLKRALAGSSKGKEGFSGRDLIEVDVKNPVVDGIRERARFSIHRFDSDLYDRLTRDRQRVAESLVEGHRVLKEGDPGRAGISLTEDSTSRRG